MNKAIWMPRILCKRCLISPRCSMAFNEWQVSFQVCGNYFGQITECWNSATLSGRHEPNYRVIFNWWNIVYSRTGNICDRKFSPFSTSGNSRAGNFRDFSASCAYSLSQNEIPPHVFKVTDQSQFLSLTLMARKICMRESSCTLISADLQYFLYC